MCQCANVPIGCAMYRMVIGTLLHYTKQLTFIECFRNEVVKKGKKLRNFKVYRTEMVYLCYRN